MCLMNLMTIARSLRSPPLTGTNATLKQRTTTLEQETLMNPAVELGERCSRWTRCSANQCPLDPMAERRPPVDGDPEQTCRAPLAERLALAAEAKRAGLMLPWDGLTLEETESGRPIKELLAEDQTRQSALLARRREAAKRMNSKRGRSRHKQGEITVKPQCCRCGSPIE
jgi:hypothetical protein